MPLEPGRKIGYDVSRMTFEFTMVDDKAKVVSCEISNAAMDELAGVRGTMPAERSSIFPPAGSDRAHCV